MTDRRPVLKTLIVELTQRCNHACRHCYNVWHSDSPGRPSGYPRGELGTAQTLALLTKALGEITCSHVTLTGGEPLLRQDLPQILDWLRQLRSPAPDYRITDRMWQNMRAAPTTAPATAPAK